MTVKYALNYQDKENQEKIQMITELVGQEPKVKVVCVCGHALDEVCWRDIPLKYEREIRRIMG